MEHASIAIELNTTQKLKEAKRKNKHRLPSFTSTDDQNPIDIYFNKNKKKFK